MQLFLYFSPFFGPWNCFLSICPAQMRSSITSSSYPGPCGVIRCVFLSNESMCHTENKIREEPLLRQ